MNRVAPVILIATLMLLYSENAPAQIETLVMPGEVIVGHEDIEAECDNCHVAFARDKQRQLCLDCHEDIADDVNRRRGFHGLFGDARDDACASCHTDHEGRDAQIVILDESAFDHRYTNFALHGRHVDVACRDCHKPGEKHRDATGTCHSCHDDEVHQGALGEECGSCHSPSGWTDVDFDHATTGYILEGKHGDAGCLDCHSDRTFAPAPTACIDCHADDDVHEGRSGPECGNCHNPSGWQDTSFNHARDTRFALDGSHANLACGDCHSDEPFTDALATECISCHAADDNHDGHFGQACESCHATTEWPDVRFEHARDAGHELLGKHASARCESCHVEPIFDTPLETGCNACHAADDPHDGTQGTACADCHNEWGWSENVFFDHDLTAFPLLGQHARQECSNCHVTQVFKDAPTACSDCHAEDDHHAGRLGDDCGICHNPVDWTFWHFDHDTQTSFALNGAHTEVACDDCHRRPLQQQTRLGSRCADCHRSDDIHDGEFGSDCGRCHSADSFGDVRSIR